MTTVLAASVQAATVTSANDFLTTLQSGELANHQVVFTTPTGAAEGTTILLSFDSSFDTSLITENDVDIEDDGTDLTTASDCSGSEEASVSIASDIITITICSGDGGAISAASSVTIKVGTNATNSGTGSNQVTNPTNTGTYFVSLSGTFGDVGSIVLPIGGDDSVAVSATVPEPSGGGDDGGGGGGGGDVTGPVISSVLVSEITGTTATVTWTTNELADSAVDYGETMSFEIGTVSSSSFLVSHGIGLSGLSEATTIYFRVRSTDTNSNTSSSSTQTFTTLDETDPVISDIEVIDLTTTTARVTWTTDEAADSRVSYGETTEYEFSETESDLKTSHSVLLTDLTEGTEYHFQALSSDAFSNQAYSDDQTFTTESDDAPTNVSGLTVTEGDGQLTLDWTNPDDEDLAGILVLLCEGDYPSSYDDTDCTTAQDSLVESAEVTGLSNNTTYYVGVFSYDNAGQFASGALGSGTPSAPEEEVPSEESEEPEEIGETDESEEETPMGEEDSDTDEESPDDSGLGEPDAHGEETDEAPGEAVTCGDDVCSSSETPDSCSADCTADEEPTSLGAEEGELDSEDISFLVADNELELELGDSGAVDVLPTSTLSIEVPSTDLVSDVESVILSVGDETYLMSLDEETDAYSADVTTPDTSATYLVSIEVTYEDGSTESISSLLRVLSRGYVYQVIDGEEVIIPGVTLTLYEVVDGESVVWDGSPYGQFNPTTSDADGMFAWYVPEGMYMVQAQVDGFETFQTDELIVTNSIVNLSILMIASTEVEPVEEPVTQEPEPTHEPETVAGVVLEIILDSPVVEVVQEGLDTIREVPGVEKAAVVSVPTLAVTAGASVVVLTVAFDFLPFLQYFFTVPILFFWRRKRKGHGIVYNAISKTPVDLAVVRLFSVSEEDEAQGRRGHLVKSRVTDKGGRYFFLVPPGRYRLTVTKAGFQFPTEYLGGERVDGLFLDLYHGEPIEVSAQDAVITANVPMDPSQADKFQAPKAVIWRNRLRMIQHGVASMGVIAATVFAIIRPTFFSVGMIAIQIALYLLARRLAKPRKPISWGIVYDKYTGRPLSRVVARIFEPKYNKLLETQVTDNKGRYAFMLGPNEYYAVFQKTGYEPKEIKPIDYKDNQGPKDFSEDLELDPKEDAATSDESKS